MPQGQSQERAAELQARWLEKTRKRQLEALEQVGPFEVELPSGDSVLAIKGNLLSIVEAGRIPDALTPFVMDLINMSGPDPEAQAAVMTAVQDQWMDWVKVLDNVWLALVVSPKCTTDFIAAQDSPDLIPVRLIALDDKIALFNWAQGVSDYLAAFRVAEDGAARAVADEPGVSKVYPGGDVGDRAVQGSLAVVADQPGDVEVGPMGRRADRGAGAGPGRPAAKRKANDLDPQIHL